MRSARRERHETRRGQLLDAAVSGIRRHGSGVSMEQLAAEAGVTKPILYRHFGDREGLIRAIGARYVSDLMTRLRDAMAQDLEPRELLIATIDAYVGFVEEDPDVYRFLTRQAGSMAAGAAHRELNDFIRQVGREVTVVMGEQLRAAGLDSGPAEAWSFGIVGMVHLAGDWWLDRQTMPRSRLVEYLVDLLWTGLESIAAGAAARAGQPAAEPVAEPSGRDDVVHMDARREVSGK